MADQNITALPVATTPESSDQILLVGATEEKLIDYDKLADAILNKLTSKNFSLDQGAKTLLQALNELNSKTLINSSSAAEYLFKLILDKSSFSIIIMYGSTSMDMPFLHLIFIDTLANNRRAIITKILDKNSSRNFTAEYNDTTQMLKITTSSGETIWGGIRIIAIV